MDIAIYGAQGYALGAYKALKTLYPKRVIPCFLVTAMKENSSALGDVPVREISDFSKSLSTNEKQNIQVMIATPENVMAEIEETLEDYGFHNYRRLDSQRRAELMKLFHVRLGRFLPLTALPVGYNRPFVRMFMAVSHNDKPLKQNVALPDYVYPLQVGADNTKARIASLFDSSNENISEKNVNYSELTGLYWIWKNKLCNGESPVESSRQYYGLMQYRRMLNFSEDDLLRLLDNDVDVVLPYPMPYEPNIHAHHERYLKECDWNALLTALREKQPDYVNCFYEILEQQYLYNYNVILAKKNVLRKYCEWLFPILERTEELSVPKGSERRDRYIGYMAESLETLYFMKNADRLNVVHTECWLYI